MKLIVNRRSLLALTREEISGWDSLLTQSENYSAFLSFSFAKAVQISGASVEACVWSRGRCVLAVLAYQFNGSLDRWLRSAVPVGDHMADYAGLVAHRDFRISTAQLLESCSLHSLRFTHLDESQTMFGLKGGQPIPGNRIVAGDPGAFIEELRSRNKRLAQDTERRRRKLLNLKGALTFAIDSTTGDSFDWLVDMKLKQYQRTGQAIHPLSDSKSIRLLQELAHQSDPLCQPRLTTLYFDGRRIAAHFGLQCLDTLSYWFPVYDPEFKKYSPGRLLLWETLAHAPQLGIRKIDRGAGDTDSKRDFANENHLYLRGAYYARSARARLARSRFAAQWRLDALRNHFCKPTRE